MRKSNVLIFPTMTKKLDNPPNRIREWRKARGLSQTELADAIGITYPIISGMETGRRDLTVQYMRAIARVLGITPADLLNGDDNPMGADAESQRLMAAYRSATPDHRRAIHSVAESLTGFSAQPEILPFSQPDGHIDVKEARRRAMRGD